MCSDISISIDSVSKCYQMYDRPFDRLKQLFVRSSGKKYYREFWAVKGVSIEIKKGEVVGIIGRNGSGKSTLLQMIAGTLQPTEGVIKTNGTLTALLELGSGFNPDFTGHENIYLNGSILGLTSKQVDQYYDDIVEFADIGEHLYQPVKTYSSGMAVRLAFAVQACIQPEILIVDEALAVGDEKFQRKCFGYIERLKEQGCSILLVTHSTATIEKFCQRAVLMHQGEVHAIGQAKDVVDQYHALLYTDKEEYYKRLKAERETEKKDSTSFEMQSSLPIENKKNIDVKKRAEILTVNITNRDDYETDFFETGDEARIRLHVVVHNEIEELQAGILLRTVEGVSAFGTSTMYFNKNITNLSTGSYVVIQFSLKLQLSPGTYFLTTSIAEALPNNDMEYLDRKSDSATLRIEQIRPHSNGIAYLPTEITIK